MNFSSLSFPARTARPSILSGSIAGRMAAGWRGVWDAMSQMVSRRRISMAGVGLTLFCGTMLPGQLHAQTYWLGGTDGVWSNANWTADAAGTIATPAPTASSGVIFSATGAGNQNTSLGADFTIQSLMINDTIPVTIGGANTLTISGSAGTGITVNTGANLTISANVTLAGASDTIAVNGTGLATISGVLGGTNVIKTGASSLTLTGLNTYTGTTTISAGTIFFNHNAALSTGTVTLGDANTGTSATSLLATAPMNSDNAGTVNGGAIANNIVVSSQGTGTAIIGTTTFPNGGGFASTTFTGSLTLNRATTLQGGNGDRTTFTGVISGNVGTLTIAGGGRVTIGGAADNTFVGDIQVTGAGTILQLNGPANAVTDSANVDLGAGTTLFMTKDTGAEAINALTGTGTVSTNIGTLQTLTVGANGGSGSFGGVIQNGSGTLALVKSGAGGQALAGASTYGGGTTISAGTLLANNAAGSATGSGAVTINTGATLGGSGTMAGPVTLNSGGFIAPGAVAAGTSTATLTAGSLIWNGGGQLNLQLGATDAASDRVALTGALTKGTAGTFTLNLTDAGGLGSQPIYTLVSFASTTFAVGDFTLTALPAGFAGTLALDADSLDLSLTFAATGTLIQNSAPTSLPVIADYTVDGAGQTGTPAESNTINSLLLTPGSSLQIFNTLTVTSGNAGDTGPGQTSITGGTLAGPNGLTFNVQGQMDVTSTLQGDLTKTGPGALLVNGTVQGNAQVLAGSFGGNATITGNLINSGTVGPGNSPGIISVGGNYTQTSSGTLRIEVGGRKLGQFDRMLIGGGAQLDGTLDLVRQNGFNLKRGDKIEFLTAALEVDGEFARVNNSFTSATILLPTVVYHDNSVALEMVQGSFAEFAARWGLSPNQRAVAAALDSAAFDTKADKLIAYLDDRKLEKLPGDFDRIGPEELTSIFTVSTALATVQSINTQRRTADLRSGANGFSASGLAMNGTGPGYSGSLSGAAGPSGKESNASNEVFRPTPDKRWGAFLTGVGEWVDVDGDGNARGYDITTGGFTVGVDYKLSPNFAVGVMGGYAGTGTDLTDEGSVWVNGGKLGLYATTFIGGWYADAAVNGGYNSYDTKRSALQGTARGSTNGGELNVLVGTGYDLKIGALQIGPTATFNYTLVGIDGFTEHGSLAPLNIASRNAESVRSALGFKASYDWKIGGVIVKPEIRAAWQHEYGDSSYGLDASFANGAGNSFLVNGPEIGRDSLLLGAGFAIQMSATCATYFYYDGELGREHYDSHNVSGGLRVAF